MYEEKRRPQQNDGSGRCQICGTTLQYGSAQSPVVCRVCGLQEVANVVCTSGHYVCEGCHEQEYYSLLAGYALTLTSQDPMAIAESLLRETMLLQNGNEHYALPVVALLTALKNYGAIPLPGGEVRSIDEEDIREGIRRVRQIPPCACAYLGACGAGLGVGIVVSILFHAHCEQDIERSLTMRASQTAVAAIANSGGPACCKQSVRTAVLVGSQLLKEMLRVYLPLSRSKCFFQAANHAGCKGARCSFGR
ncbi:DUF5714 domain-containing protein [Azotosporobacter soli]|uniref:DUF5714 domain-containing protein n=1 Tax=Azotosporobacter soli TaxID=3055040 RepID=UPI0031FF0185